MATDPQFAATVALGAGTIGTAETNLNVPAQAITVVTAGGAGTKIEEIVIHASTTSLTPTTVAGNVYIFLHDGTNAFLYDTIPVTAVTASTTVAPFRTSRTYANLWLKSGWTLRASQSIAGNASLLKIEVFGGDY